MESLRLSFQAVAPIFLLLAVGYLLRRCRIVNPEIWDGINKLSFQVFLPVLLFHDVAKTQLTQLLNARLLIFLVAAICLVFLIGSFAVLFLTKDNAKRGVMLQGFFRSNFAILGLPLVGYVCKGATSGLSSLAVAIVVPLFNILAVIALERFRSGKIRPRQWIRGILQNPLMIGCLLGGLFLVLNIPLPSAVDTAVGNLAQVASPLAIVALGAGFDFSDFRACGREVIITVATRLILVPLLVLPVGVALGFRGEALACLLAAFASPMAVSSFAMSQQMEGDETLASQVIVISSALCPLTLFGWIWAFHFLQLF